MVDPTGLCPARVGPVRELLVHDPAEDLVAVLSAGTPHLFQVHDLDAACPDRSVLIVKHDGHMVIANTRALEEAGVSADTEDPPGGIIDREADGIPAGPFREAASEILMSAVPVPELDDLVQGAKNTFGRISARYRG